MVVEGGIVVEVLIMIIVIKFPQNPTACMYVVILVAKTGFCPAKPVSLGGSREFQECTHKEVFSH